MFTFTTELGGLKRMEVPVQDVLDLAAEFVRREQISHVSNRGTYETLVDKQPHDLKSWAGS